MITGWKDFPCISQGEKILKSLCIHTASSMNLFTTASYLVTWAMFVPEILSHNWRLIWFPRLLRVVDSGGLGWVEIDYSNHKEVGVPKVTVPLLLRSVCLPQYSSDSAGSHSWEQGEGPAKGRWAGEPQGNWNILSREFWVLTAPPESITAETSQLKGSGFLKCLM